MNLKIWNEIKKDQELRMVDLNSALKFSKGISLNILLTVDKKIIVFFEDFRYINNIDIRNKSFLEITKLDFFVDNPGFMPILLNNLVEQINQKNFKNINFKIINNNNYSKNDIEFLLKTISNMSFAKKKIIVSSSQINVLELLPMYKTFFKIGYIPTKISKIDYVLLSKFNYFHPNIKQINCFTNIKRIKNINLPMNVISKSFLISLRYKLSYKIYGELIFSFIVDINRLRKTNSLKKSKNKIVN